MNPHSFYMYHLKVFVNHWYSERFEKLKSQSAEYVNFFLKMYLDSISQLCCGEQTIWESITSLESHIWPWTSLELGHALTAKRGSIFYLVGNAFFSKNLIKLIFFCFSFRLKYGIKQQPNQWWQQFGGKIRTTKPTEPTTKRKVWIALGDHGSKVHSYDGSTKKSDSR